MANSHGRFVWYELATTDMEAAKAFYTGGSWAGVAVELYPLAPSSAAAALAVAAHGGIGGHEGKWCAAALTPRIKESSRPHFQSDGDLSGLVSDGREQKATISIRRTRLGGEGPLSL
jgi:hypothetical protein